MTLLTVLVMARDEEVLLPRCLDSLHYERPDPAGQPNHDGLYPVWDELIVIDAGGSMDQTWNVAKAYGAKVYPYPKLTGKWPLDDKGNEIRDYAAARNYGESLAHGKYVYWQDADEVMVEGHERLREIAARDEAVGVRPIIRITEDGRTSVFPRQDLLHQRGAYTWQDPFHEFTTGPVAGVIDEGIVVEQIERPDGDRPHGDPFDGIRRNMGTGLAERHLYYLAREHANAGHWQEVIALADLLYKQAPQHAQQRSLAMILKGDAYKNIGDMVEGRRAYLASLGEWGNWAEPYYALAVLCVICERWQEAIAWLSASLIWEPGGENITMDIYTWKRFDLMAVCLAKMGRLHAALEYTRKALDAKPGDEAIIERLRVLEEALKKPSLYAVPGSR